MLKSGVFIVAASVVSILLGCSHGMSDQEYGVALDKVFHEYLDYANDLAKQSPPVQPGMTRDARLAALSKSVHDTGDRFESMQKELEALRPPDKYEGVQRESVQFFKIQADEWHRWGDAISKDDRATADRISQEMDTAPSKQMLKIEDEMEKLAANDPKMAQELEELKRRTTQQEQALGSG